MVKGQYLNPKYARRERFRRRLVITLAAVVLTFCCVTGIYRIDTTIRSTMLPQASPVAELNQLQPMQYELRLFNRQYTISIEWAYTLVSELDAVVRTPPPPVRIFYQLRAYLTNQLPRNARNNPRDSTGV